MSSAPQHFPITIPHAMLAPTLSPLLAIASHCMTSGMRKRLSCIHQHSTHRYESPCTGHQPAARDADRFHATKCIMPSACLPTRLTSTASLSISCPQVAVKVLEVTLRTPAPSVGVVMLIVCLWTCCCLDQDTVLCCTGSGSWMPGGGRNRLFHWMGCMIWRQPAPLI